jgi:hypothetical protein
MRNKQIHANEKKLCDKINVPKVAKKHHASKVSTYFIVEGENHIVLLHNTIIIPRIKVFHSDHLHMLNNTVMTL